MTDQKIQPASDEDIERILTYIRLSPWGRDTIKRRMSWDRARIRELEARVTVLEDLIATKSEGDSYRDNDGCLPARLKGRSRYEAADEAFETEAERIRAARARIRELELERNLAVAHDRQPYPTAWAYEQACKALATAREQIRAKDEQIARLRGIVVAVAQGRPEGAAYSAHFVEDARAALSKPEPGR